MGIRDFFKKDKQPPPEPVTDITLSTMKLGYLVDYDLKSWEVTAAHHYDWGEGDISYEWQLTSADETVCLEKETDDEVAWSLYRKIALSRLGGGVTELVRQTGDPPKEIVLDGVTYYQEEMSGGHFFENGQGPGRQMISWHYEDDDGQRYLCIEQWGETAFEASLGEPVEEYQFSDILPKKN
ncbi:MAG: DUF4178 domain-containing protein [Deltaproteobacteria bacterium]|nr:DUF4178 domain-containing protein [Deltaproteobacteria bacterium]